MICFVFLSFYFGRKFLFPREFLLNSHAVIKFPGELSYISVTIALTFLAVQYSNYSFIDFSYFLAQCLGCVILKKALGSEIGKKM